MSPAQRADLGVVVVTFRSRNFLEGCFEGLRGLVPPASVVVVDSASGDGMLEEAARLWPGVGLRALPGNLGYAAGVNEGMRALPHDYVLALNPDVRVDAAGVRLALDWLQAHPDFGMAGARLEGMDGRAQTSHFAEPTLGRMVSMYVFRQAGEPGPIRLLDGALEVQGITGAALLVRAAAAGSVGPMDERFWLYAEEVDWCRRFREHRWRLAVLPAWRLLHYGGASAAASSVPLDAYVHRSRHLYFLKHGGSIPAMAFRALLGASLPVALAVAVVNALVGRITWREAGARVCSQAAAFARVRAGRPPC